MLGSILDLTCLVQSVTDTKSAMGGVIKTYATRITSAPCSFKQKTVRFMDEYNKAAERTIYRFYFEANTTNNAITVSDRIVYDSGKFEVDSVYDVAGKGKVLQIDCTKVT